MTNSLIPKFAAESKVGKPTPAFNFASNTVIAEDNSFFDTETGIELCLMDKNEDGIIDGTQFHYKDKETGLGIWYFDYNADGITDYYYERGYIEEDYHNYEEYTDGSRYYELNTRTSNGKIYNEYCLTSDNIQTSITKRRAGESSFYDVNGDGIPDTTSLSAAESLMSDIIEQERAKKEAEEE